MEEDEEEEEEEEEAVEDIRAGLQLQLTAYTAVTTRQPLCPLVQLHGPYQIYIQLHT